MAKKNKTQQKGDLKRRLKDKYLSHEDLARSLMASDICPTFWFIHFGKTSIGNAKCEDCEDFRTDECKGGRDPKECFQKPKNCTGDCGNCPNVNYLT
jgi:hypothetical protein